MKVICSYCRSALPDKEPLDLSEISHGICPPCLEHFSRQWDGITLGEYLDDFPLPVVVVDQHNRVVAANSEMAEMLGKPPRTMLGLLGGEALECVYARLPEGCGHTVHCLTCAIRTTVDLTLTTGAPQRRVPASIDQPGGPVAYLISTYRDAPLVRVVIEPAELDTGPLS